MTKTFTHIFAISSLGLSLLTAGCDEANSEAEEAIQDAEYLETTAEVPFAEAMALAHERQAGAVEHPEDFAAQSSDPTTALNCLPPNTTGLGAYPIQVNSGGWKGRIAPNYSWGTAEIENEDGSLLGTFAISNVSSDCPWGTNTGWAEFDVDGVDDPNVHVRLETFSGFRQWTNTVTWFGEDYDRWHGWQ